MIEPLICKCCGAHINIKKQICEYCGATYRISDNTHIVEVKLITQPCDVLVAQMHVDRRMLCYSDIDYYRYIKESLASSLADKLINYMEIEESFSPDPLDTPYVRATCRILKPKYKF